MKSGTIVALIIAIALIGGGYYAYSEGMLDDIFPTYETYTETITKSDNGAHYYIGIGDTVNISLSTNPSTGYHWVLSEYNMNVLHLDERFYWGVNADPVIVGAPCMETWIFKAVGLGKTTVKIDYMSPSDDSSRSFIVYFIVCDDIDLIEMDISVEVVDDTPEVNYRAIQGTPKICNVYQGKADEYFSYMFNYTLIATIPLSEASYSPMADCPDCGNIYIGSKIISYEPKNGDLYVGYSPIEWGMGTYALKEATLEQVVSVHHWIYGGPLPVGI